MFWNKQAITKSNDCQPKIINKSPLELDEWSPNNSYKFSDYFDIQTIVDFVNKYNEVGDTTITCMQEKSLSWIFDKWDTLRCLLLDSKNEIAAFCIAPVFECQIENTVNKVANTTYLVVRKDLRGKGVASWCIREIMRQGTKYSPPVYIGYHQVSKPIGLNSIAVDSYFLPLNVKVCKRLGFKMSGSYSTLREKYKIPKHDEYSIEHTTKEKHTASIAFALKRFKFGITPDSFFRFVKHPEYTLKTITVKDIPVAHVLFRDWPIRFRGKQIVKVCLIEYFLGGLDCFYFFLDTIKDKYPLVYFNIMGTTAILEKASNVERTGTRYLNFYNWDGYYYTKDLSLIMY